MAGRVHVGIAGWSYEDWKGVVYPRGCRDTLRFCAELVDCIEINSSFYRTPAARTCASWLKRTEDLPFFFTAKLPQAFTHQHTLEPTDVAAVREAFLPLAEAGKLRMQLAQFNFRFPATDANRGHLAGIVNALEDLAPIAVEVRHRSWAEDDALTFLEDLDVSVAHLDYPGVGSGFDLYRTELHGSARTAYFRLHGRNFDNWFRKDAGRDEVYDYDYPPDELGQIRRRIDEVMSAAGAAREAIVIANNHFHGQGMKTALELISLREERPVKVPGPLLETFPALKKIAVRAPGQRGLFDRPKN